MVGMGEVGLFFQRAVLMCKPAERAVVSQAEDAAADAAALKKGATAKSLMPMSVARTVPALLLESLPTSSAPTLPHRQRTDPSSLQRHYCRCGPRCPSLAPLSGWRSS